MVRFLLWLIVLYMVVKVVRIFANWKQTGHSASDRIDHTQQSGQQFSNVQDADFEDITPKPSSSAESQQPQKDR